MLIRYLPRESALVSAINDGEPVWSSTEHLLADLWALLVRVNSDPAKTAKDIDHPARAAMATKSRAATRNELKALFQARKSSYTKSIGR